MVTPAVSIEVLGIDELNKTLSLITKDAKLMVDKAMLRAGFMVEREAKKRCPVDTGRLKSSINTVAKGISGEFTSLGNETISEVIISPHTNYAAFVEYGTSRMKAQPYMRPALNEKQEAIIKEVKNAIDLAVKKDLSAFSTAFKFFQ